MKFVFVLCLGQAIISGRRDISCMWAELAGENNPCPIGMRIGVYITASLSKCGRVGGIYLRHLHAAHSVPVSSFIAFLMRFIVNVYF